MTECKHLMIECPSCIEVFCDKCYKTIDEISDDDKVARLELENNQYPAGF